MTRAETMHYVHEGAGGGRGQPCPCCAERMGHVWHEAVVHGVKFLRCPCGVEWEDHRTLREPCPMTQEEHKKLLFRGVGIERSERLLRDEGILRACRLAERRGSLTPSCKKKIAETYGVTVSWVHKLLRRQKAAQADE